jgi:hypothetical protein
LSWIEELLACDEEGGHIFTLFERFVKTTNKITFSEPVARKIIKIYFGLENRNVLLN